MYKNYKIFDNQLPKIEHYIDFIDQGWPYRFFATLTFQYKMTDAQGIMFASRHLKRFNKKLLGKRWQKLGLKCVTGIAVLEHAGVRKVAPNGRALKDLGSCHFHFLLQDHPIFHTDLEASLKQVTAAWEKAARSLNYKDTRKLVSFHGTDVQIFQTTGVYGYMLKEAKNHGWEHQERLFYVDREGLLHVDMNLFRKSFLFGTL
jgi:hypothetical protein